LAILDSIRGGSKNFELEPEQSEKISEGLSRGAWS